MDSISADVSKIRAHVARIADRGGSGVFPSDASVRQADGSRGEPYLKNFCDKLGSSATSMSQAAQTLQERAQQVAKSLMAVAEGLKGADDQAQAQLQALLETLGTPASAVISSGASSAVSGAGSGAQGADSRAADKAQIH